MDDDLDKTFANPDEALRYLVEHCDDITEVVFFTSGRAEITIGDMTEVLIGEKVGGIVTFCNGTRSVLPLSIAKRFRACGVLDRLGIPNRYVRLRNGRNQL